MRPLIGYISAGSTIGAVAWLAPPVFLCALVHVPLLRRDFDIRERAISNSQRIHHALTAQRSGNPLSAKAAQRKAKRLPTPRLPGKSDIVVFANRQIAEAWRRWRSSIFIFGIVAAATPYVLDRLAALIEDDAFAGIFGPTLLFYALLFVIVLLRYDFRNDLDRIDVLKTLPIRPLHMAIGQMLPNYLYFLANTALVTATATATFGPTPKIVVISLFTIPVSALIIAYLNVMILVYPPRQVTAGAVQLQLFSRILFQAFVGSVAVVALVLIAGAPAVVAFELSGSMTAALTTAWLICAVIACVLVYGVALAFDRYDPSKRMG